MLASAKCRAIATLATLAIFGTILSVTPKACAQSEQSGQGLTGAWRVTVTLDDCNGNVLGAAFPSMLLFSRGGALTETTSNPAFFPGQRSTGIGTWWRNPDGTYSGSDVAFILYSAGPFTAGTQEITHTITLSSDETKWTDKATVKFFDANGTLGKHPCATATATRIQ
jgi:hypothetical protein